MFPAVPFRLASVLARRWVCALHTRHRRLKAFLMKMQYIGLSLLLFSTYCILTNEEMYSALVSLENLLQSQKVVVAELDRHIAVTEIKLKQLTRFREEYSYVFQKSRVDFQNFISNPINAFALIKKLTVDLAQVMKFLSNCPKLDDKLPNGTLPNEDDLMGAAKALLRIQQTYGIATSDLADGKVKGASNTLHLSADDCFELGRQAFNSGCYDFAISWLEEASRRSVQTNRSNAEILNYLNLSIMEKEKSSVMYYTMSLLQLGLELSLTSNGDAYASSDAGDANVQFFSQTNPVDEAIYRNLCQMEKDQASSNVYHPYLRCRLVSRHPYMLLQPIKEEHLWLAPKISIFHDVLSAFEIDLVKSLARPHLQRAEVAEYIGEVGHRVSDNRVTKISWLAKEHPEIARIYERIETITGLSSETAEPFQIANYGLGGHFHLHMDVLPNTEKYFGPSMGNRIATWLIYLSDVNGGGATVFPRLNLTVWPQKGSAVFWYNIKSNGIGDPATLHGACPVVAGSKWVSNVWFHERGQEFRLRCGLHPESELLPNRS